MKLEEYIFKEFQELQVGFARGEVQVDPGADVAYSFRVEAGFINVKLRLSRHMKP